MESSLSTLRFPFLFANIATKTFLKEKAMPDYTRNFSVQHQITELCMLMIMIKVHVIISDVLGNR